MPIPFVTATQLREALPFQVAIDALEQAFRSGGVVAPPRERHETTAGDLLVMPAWGGGALGVKLVTVNRDNPENGLPLIHGVYILFHGHGAPLALLDAEELTRIRTAAVSGVATRLVSPSDARVLVVFGAGVQARGHVEAMRTVRPIERVIVVSRSQPRAHELVDSLREAFDIDASVGVPEDVAAGEIVCTCTTSNVPVFDGKLLASGAHVNAVGSYRPDAREIDDASMSRTAFALVEDLDIALAEAGDVVMSLAAGALDRARVRDLRSALLDPPSLSQGDITVFKSVGMAMEDLTVARLVAERLRPL
jgi:ornithine cyclodeaminase